MANNQNQAVHEEPAHLSLDFVNDDQWHTVSIHHMEFNLPIRYQNPTFVGSGGFGAVVSADDTVTGKRVAIKRLSRPFVDELHSQRTYRELNFLTHLNHKDSSTISLQDAFTLDKNQENFQSLYLVLNYVPYNLHQFIRRKIPIGEDHLKLIIYQILRGLKYMHSAGIIHRDIKPTNIGIDGDSNVYILDFGLTRLYDEQQNTTYVGSQYWRAPEIILTKGNYDHKIDVWATGCIMAELILLEPAFPGENSFDQLRKIVSIVGTPTPETILRLGGEELAERFLQIGNYPEANFNELFGYKYDSKTGKAISGVGQSGIDFLKTLLNFDHQNRPTVEQALQHSFMTEYHDQQEEITIDPIIDEHGNVPNYTIDQWKELVWNLVKKF